MIIINRVCIGASIVSDQNLCRRSRESRFLNNPRAFPLGAHFLGVHDGVMLLSFHSKMRNSPSAEPGSGLFEEAAEISVLITFLCVCGVFVFFFLFNQISDLLH